MKEPTKIEVSDRMGNLVALSCEHDNARFHIWINPITKRHEGILYKNPPLDASEERQFKTRELDPERGVGAILMPKMLARFDELMAQFLLREAEVAAARQRELEEKQRRYRIQQAAEDLFTALEWALRGRKHSQPCEDSMRHFGSDCSCGLKQAQAAYDKAIRG